MGDYSFTQDEYKAAIWCLKNNIGISPIFHSSGEWKLEITINGKCHTSPESYGKIKIWEKQYEYYKYYYDKYRN